MIVDDDVNGGVLLERGRASETLYGSLPSSERLMGVLRPIIQPSCSVLTYGDAQVSWGCVVGAEAVGNDTPR